MNDKEIVTREEARHLALTSAMKYTYPETLDEESEPLFLRIFQARMHAECSEATSEDIEWARKRLSFLREEGLSFEEVDRIADLVEIELTLEDAEAKIPDVVFTIRDNLTEEQRKAEIADLIRKRNEILISMGYSIPEN